MSSRGVTVGDRFNKRQLEAIELFATGEYTCGKVAKEVGVNPCTISAWRKNSQFMDAIIERSRELLKEALPAIYNKASDEAIKGSAQFVKILLDHLEKLEHEKTQRADATIVFKWDI